MQILPPALLETAMESALALALLIGLNDGASLAIELHPQFPTYAECERVCRSLGEDLAEFDRIECEINSARSVLSGYDWERTAGIREAVAIARRDTAICHRLWIACWWIKTLPTAKWGHYGIPAMEEELRSSLGPRNFSAGRLPTPKHWR